MERGGKAPEPPGSSSGEDEASRSAAVRGRVRPGQLTDGGGCARLDSFLAGHLRHGYRRRDAASFSALDIHPSSTLFKSVRSYY